MQTLSVTQDFCCTCWETTGESCRATWHVRKEEPEPHWWNRHERRKAAKLKRRRK